MDGRGGCCIARYAPGAYDMSKVDRIMLRFRPIAPKPVAGATTGSDGSSTESSGSTFSKGGNRTKRKYVRDNNNKTNSNGNNNNNRRTRRRKTTTSSPENNRPAAPVVTLPLLPETPDPKEPHNNNKNNTTNSNNSMNRNLPVWLSFENRGEATDPYWYGGTSDHTAARVVGASSYSCVTVECVTDTWSGEGLLLGRNDDEWRVNLGDDTCPGFISDGYGRVTWTNGAYREMVGQEGEVLVLLVVKVGAVVPNYPCNSFTCRVRVVQYEFGKERNSLTLPCDVWRLDSGGFAWRLDLKAALTLRLLGC